MFPLLGTSWYLLHVSASQSSWGRLRFSPRIYHSTVAVPPWDSKVWNGLKHSLNKPRGTVAVAQWPYSHPLAGCQSTNCNSCSSIPLPSSNQSPSRVAWASQARWQWYRIKQLQATWRIADSGSDSPPIQPPFLQLHKHFLALLL